MQMFLTRKTPLEQHTFCMLDYNATLDISVITHENILVSLTGDFGAAQISVTVLTISDPDVRYSAGDQLEVKF